MKTTIRYCNIHDAGRLPDHSQFTCAMIPPLDKQTLRTLTWIADLSTEDTFKETKKRPTSKPG